MIQEFCPRQLDDVMRLWLEENLQAHPFVPASYWRQNADAVRAAIPRARVWVWVEQDGAVGGFLGLQDGYIAGLFVERRLQGRGVGTRLLRHVQSLSDTLALDVYAANRRAVEFYRAQGFAVSSSRIDPQTGRREYRMCWTAGQ